MLPKLNPASVASTKPCSAMRCEDQQVILRVVEPMKKPDEATRRATLEEFRELCRKGTENRERQGISLEEADQILEEAILAVRSGKTE